jgi:hypothetical protein
MVQATIGVIRFFSQAGDPATPREWAKRKGHAAILKLLDEHKR